MSLGDGRLRYLSAASFVAGGLVLRFLMAPVFGAAHTYTVFYPVVLLAAYGLGARPAAFATLLSAAVGYWCFAPPAFQWKLGAAGVAAASFFVITSSIAIYLITGLKQALDEVAGRQGRAEALARSHAELFRELSERVTDHLQLVSGLLALRAQGEGDAALAAALNRASERSLLIARIHRQLDGQGGETVDFQAFAQALLATALPGADEAPPEVVTQGEVLSLPRDQATSLGVALLECVTAVARRDGTARLRVALGADGHEARFRISRIDGRTGISSACLDGAFLLNAMVEQLGGRLRLAADVQGSALELSFPRPGAEPVMAVPAILH